MSSSKKYLTSKGTSRQDLSEFIEWRYWQSCWYFRPCFVNCCPSNLLFGWTPLFSVRRSVLNAHICTVFKGGDGILGLGQINICCKVPLQVNIFRWWHFALPSMSLSVYCFIWSKDLLERGFLYINYRIFFQNCCVFALLFLCFHLLSRNF